MCNSFSDIHSSIFDDEWHKWVEITSTVDVWLRHATAWPVDRLWCVDKNIQRTIRVLRKVALNGNSSQVINHEDSQDKFIPPFFFPWSKVGENYLTGNSGISFACRLYSHDWRKATLQYLTRDNKVHRPLPLPVNCPACAGINHLALLTLPIVAFIKWLYCSQ